LLACSYYLQNPFLYFKNFAVIIIFQSEIAARRLVGRVKSNYL
jgi:hypothetical protein